MRNKIVICGALLSILATPTLASGFKFVDGEAVWAYVGPPPASKEAERAKNGRTVLDQQTVITDGFRYVGGEAGWIYEVRSAKESTATAGSLAALRSADAK